MLTDPDQAALLPHLGKALIHLGICVEAIAAEPGFQGNRRNSLALVGHLLPGPPPSSVRHSTRTVRDAGGPPALDFPQPGGTARPGTHSRIPTSSRSVASATGRNQTAQVLTRCWKT